MALRLRCGVNRKHQIVLPIFEKRMLLRRITQHVKDQNWTAVALDFCIIVIGIRVR